MKIVKFTSKKTSSANMKIQKVDSHYRVKLCLVQLPRGCALRLLEASVLCIVVTFFAVDDDVEGGDDEGRESPRSLLISESARAGLSLSSRNITRIDSACSSKRDFCAHTKCEEREKERYG